MRFHPILQINRLHAGIDFGEPCGTPILAAASGVVLQAGWLNAGAGNGVIIDHGTYNGQRIQTRSYHMERVDVRAGQGISRGQILGAVGTTGMSTGCHLHFEVLTDGTFVNPYPWLRR